jgi:nitroreductase
MALSARQVHALKQAPAVEGVIPAVLNRWSSRSFTEREVAQGELAKVFEAARWAASAYNEQPWRFIVGSRGTETHQKLSGALMGFNQSWASQAPVLILGMASTKFIHNGTVNSYALYDLGAAAAALTLQAAALGMTTHTMAGFDQAAARAAFAIPEEFALGAVIALGYQGEPGALGHEKLIELETTPRSRKPLSEWVWTAIGESAKLG